MKKHTISQVLPGSIGEELDIRRGYSVISIGGREIEDIFDYNYFCDSDHVELLVETEDGEEILYDIDKDEEEDLGLVFENGLMDEYRSCSNKCIFCFIDQMPPGMRETLYFKDDDSRLSFLQGNYITLTNLSKKDLDRIIAYRMEPINISVHTMDPSLRCRMLNNRFAGDALKKIDVLYGNGITMNGQIVCCPDWNDGEELRSTIEALSRYLPVMQSVSVVPVGLTKYRSGLTKLRPFTPEEAGQVIDIVEEWQRQLFPRYGLHFVHASDEFYLLAGRSIPERDRYDGYLQLENGVGMLRLFSDQFDRALKRFRTCRCGRRVTIATGVLAYPVIREKCEALCALFPMIKAEVVPVVNHFFGENVTVAGLLTGRDLIEQLQGRDNGDMILISRSMLRSGEDVFLDDLHLSDAERALGLPVIAVDNDGASLVRVLLGKEKRRSRTKFRPYEPKEITNE